MNTGVIISLVGIIIALSLLVVMVMKGINIFIIAIVCSSLVAITGSLNVYDGKNNGDYWWSKIYC